MLSSVSPSEPFDHTLMSLGSGKKKKKAQIVLKVSRILRSDIPSALISKVQTSRVLDLCVLSVLSVLLFCYDHLSGPKLDIGGKGFCR